MPPIKTFNHKCPHCGENREHPEKTWAYTCKKCGERVIIEERKQKLLNHSQKEQTYK